MKKQNFQLIIPMAGFGERFKKLGFVLPKSLIEINNQPLLSYIDSQFGSPRRKLFICNIEHLKNEIFQMQSAINKLAPEGIIAAISPHKLGPVYSIICAEDKIDDDLPTIVSYCDCLSLFDIKLLEKAISESEIDGMIFTYEGFHPNKIRSLNYAYVLEKEGYVTDVKEKESFTDEPYLEKASAGIYYFSSGKLLKKLCHNLYKNNLSTNGEFFVSMLFKELIRKGNKIKSFKINNFISWGTPEDFLDYLEATKLNIFDGTPFQPTRKKDIDNFSSIEDVEILKKRFEKYDFYGQKHLNAEINQKINNYWKSCVYKLHTL
jgi:NDP-sugar pyrophosphorylase family protein